jgi:hypothetical protein
LFQERIRKGNHLSSSLSALVAEGALVVPKREEVEPESLGAISG